MFTSFLFNSVMTMMFGWLPLWSDLSYSVSVTNSFCYCICFHLSCIELTRLRTRYGSGWRLGTVSAPWDSARCDSRSPIAYYYFITLSRHRAEMHCTGIYRRWNDFTEPNRNAPKSTARKRGPPRLEMAKSSVRNWQLRETANILWPYSNAVH